MPEFWNAEIGRLAVAGLIGMVAALLPSLIAWGKEVWFDKRKRRREAEYLAMRLVLVFDGLTTACYAAVHDELMEDQEGYSSSTVPDPTLLLPTDGDYKALPRLMMFQIMSIPSKLDEIKEGMSSAYEFSNGPDYQEFFAYRRENWSRLGLEALELSDALRREYKIPPREWPEYYEPRASFQRELAEIEQYKKRRDEANGAVTASMFANLPKADAGSV